MNGGLLSVAFLSVEGFDKKIKEKIRISCELSNLARNGEKSMKGYFLIGSVPFLAKSHHFAEVW